MRELRITIGERDVGALLVPARDAHRATLTLGHGAGAGMTHRSMEGIAGAFADVGIATLRYNFPFKEDGRSRVDAQAVSTATVAAALDCARGESPGPHLLGGHSYGGRMASHPGGDPRPRGGGPLVFSFPLHTPAKPGTKRAEHLDDIPAPMLFLSGTRDGMAQPDLLNDVAERIGATVNWLDTADHGYKVLKRTRTRSDDVFDEMAHYASAWLDTVLPSPQRKESA